VAEPLKNMLDAAVLPIFARLIGPVFPRFDAEAFIDEALLDYEALDLMARGLKIARALRSHLPQDYAAAAEILMASLQVDLESITERPLTSFIYLPHSFFIAEYGLDDFESSMRAQYELTQRFTAEFSMRPFLQRHPQLVLQRFADWARDPNQHVRRLVSESTRPRLPWAPRLRAFQKDPQPVLALLELLKDDPEFYVRRSVANNLNDIGKDHPELLFATAARWSIDASEERRWIVRHALRSAVKRAEPGALKILGFGAKANVEILHASIAPARIPIGTAVTIGFSVFNNTAQPQQALIDFRIHYIKANGKTSAKVFKLKTIELFPQQTVALSKKVSLQEMTTRKHYAGVHRVDIVINGVAEHLGEFELVA
jgi:3-methyladenine DNA glycosylase AlkC